MRIGLKIFSVIFLLNVFACGNDSIPSFKVGNGTGSIMLGVTTNALTPGKVYGKVRYYTSRDKALSDDVWYVSDCQPMGSIQSDVPANIRFNLTDLKAGENEVISIYFYSDNKCKNLEGKAVRGGITISGDSSDDKNIPKYFLQFVQKSGFSAFPVPQANSGTTTCDNSDKCITTTQPTAFCDKTSNICRYDNLYPLNNRGYVAFGKGISLNSGQIIGSPGVTKDTFADALAPQTDSSGTQMVLTFNTKAPVLSGFDGITDLFLEQTLSSIQGHAFAGIAKLPNGSTVITGGATKMPVQSKVVPTYYDKDKNGNPIYTQTADATASIIAVTNDGVIASKGVLDNKFFGASAFVVGKSANEYKLFIANGLVQDPDTKEWTPTKDIHVCSVDDAENIACDSKMQTAATRVGAAYTCMETKNGICQKEILLGGDLGVHDPFADICTIDGCKGADLVEDTGQAKPRINNRGLFTSQAFTLGTHIYTLGGSTWFPGIDKNSMDSWPSVFEYLPQTNGQLKIKTPTLSDYVKTALRGLYQVITRIDENTVLVTGGLTPDYHDGNLPVSNKAVLLKWADKGLTAKVFTMTYRRFAHQAAMVSTGPLKGAILVWGGLTIDKNLDLNYIRHAEIFLP